MPTQLDIAVKGDDERLAEEIRGFHWMVVYGGYLSHEQCSPIIVKGHKLGTLETVDQR